MIMLILGFGGLEGIARTTAATRVITVTAWITVTFLGAHDCCDPLQTKEWLPGTFALIPNFLNAELHPEPPATFIPMELPPDSSVLLAPISSPVE